MLEQKDPTVARDTRLETEEVDEFETTFRLKMRASAHLEAI